MAYDQNAIHKLYKKLLNYYPRAFRQQLGESMEQTFNDLFNERKRQTHGRLFGVVLWMFVETAVGIIREHVTQIAKGIAMKKLPANSRSAASLGFILCLPLAALFVIFTFDLEPFIRPLKELLTTDGQQINHFGRIVIFGALLLLPIAFVLNLQPILKKAGPEGKRTFYTINIIVGTSILLLIIFTWGGLILESIYCLQGIHCD